MFQPLVSFRLNAALHQALTSLSLPSESPNQAAKRLLVGLLSQVNIPVTEVNIPEVNIPVTEVNIPEVNIPVTEVNIPEVNIPVTEVNIPEVNIPEVNIPVTEVSSLIAFEVSRQLALFFEGLSSPVKFNVGFKSGDRVKLSRPCPSKGRGSHFLNATGVVLCSDFIPMSIQLDGSASQFCHAYPGELDLITDTSLENSEVGEVPQEPPVATPEIPEIKEVAQEESFTSSFQVGDRVRCLNGLLGTGCVLLPCDFVGQIENKGLKYLYLAVPGESQLLTVLASACSLDLSQEPSVTLSESSENQEVTFELF